MSDFDWTHCPVSTGARTWSVLPSSTSEALSTSRASYKALGGAVLALLGIVVGVRAVPSSEDASLWSSLLFSESIHLQEVAVILVGGAVVGVAGAVLSLRREGSASEAGE